MWIDRRWLMLGVGASVLLNVFLVGVVAGHRFDRWGGWPGSKGGEGPVVLRGHVRTLPKEERKLFQAAMGARRAAIRTARQEQQRLRATAEADIAAATFDRDKVAADFKALREGALAMQATMQDGLVEALQGLPQASRAALVAHEVGPNGPAAPHP